MNDAAPKAPHDDTRNMALADAVSDITEYITSRLAVYREATGNTVDFHLIAIDGVCFEFSSHIADPERMIDAFAEQVDRWVSAGQIEILDSDGNPLFTATFDPKQVRPS